MDRIGEYTPACGEKPACILRDFYCEGFIFKDEAAYISRPDAVCYVAELSDTVYTHNDLLALCEGQEALARACFDSLCWQHPETWTDEQFTCGEWDKCPGCGRWFACYDATECPHCRLAYTGE